MVSVALAIVVGLVSSFVQSLGLTIQRKSHVQEDLLPLPHRRKPLKRPLWLLGFVVYITSNVFSTIFQLDALPIIILAPLGAVSLIFNALLARLILGDTFGKMAMVGTGLVTGGAVMIAVFGVVKEEEHGLDELMRLWRRGPFLAFFGIMLAAVICVLCSAHIATWHVHRQLNPGQIKLEESETPPSSRPPSNYASPRSPHPIPFRDTSQQGAATRTWSSPNSHDDAGALASSPASHASPTDPLLAASPDSSDSPKAHGVRFALRSTPNNLTIDLPPADPSFAIPNAHQQRTLTLSGLAFAAASGTLSGMSLVLAKAAVELLVITIEHYRTGRGSNQFTRAESWFLVLGLGVGAVLQLLYLNYSLTFASPALICPLAFCFFNLSSIFDGLVFYDQFGRLKAYQIVLVSVGVVILLLGVWVVALIKTGEGGVDVGTWVEDADTDSECDEGEAGEEATLLGGERSMEPEEEVFEPPSPGSHPEPNLPQSPALPYSPRGVTSPRLGGPLSPTRRRSRGPRLGTLLPEYGGAPHAPAGFSIGIGAASPGFVLRSESQHHGHAHANGHIRRRSRTQSEGQAGIVDLIRGHRGGRVASMDLAREYDETRRSGEGERRGDNDAEDALRGWDDAEAHRTRIGWWRRLFGSAEGEGKIRLEGDQSEGPEGGN